MPLVGAWCKVWIYFGFVVGWSKGARPRFDTSTDMGLVLIPADAEVDSVIFRLRATDQDADFPLVFEVTATITPVVRIENLPCTLYNKVCQANVILTKRLIPGRLHDFAVRVRDTKGDSNSMQATISVTNATTPRDKIFPHIPSLIMVPEDTKPGKELDYLLVRANSWSGKPVYIELWQPKELFTIRQRQTPTQTRGIITLIGELDFETQSMYTLTMYATDPYTEPGKDTRNIAGLNVVVIVQDVQDVPPIFTLAPPLTKINNSVQPGDIILRVHAEDGDKGVPREITYGLVSEGNPFTPFFDISETTVCECTAWLISMWVCRLSQEQLHGSTGEITLARSLEELTQITHVGAPVVLTVVAEEIRRTREEPAAQATVVDVGFLLGEPGNSPPYFESDNFITTIDENLEPGSVLMFSEPHSNRVRDEDIGKAGVFALKLEGNNGTFEINPTVAERTADFIITVRDNSLIDYELYKTLSFKIVAQEVGPATNLSTSVPVTIFLRDVNDNPPVFEEESYEVTLSENVTAGTRVIQVHATDKDTGLLGSVRYTGVYGQGSEAFTMDPDTGLITVAMGSSLDREIAPKLLLSVEARDEDGKGNRGVAPLIVNLIDVNDNAPLFEKSIYEFMLNSELTNFTMAAFLKAVDADAEPPNNEVRYELIHGNYESKFHLNEITGELTLRSPITRIRRKKQSAYESYVKKSKEFVRHPEIPRNSSLKAIIASNSTAKEKDNATMVLEVNGTISNRTKRGSDDALYTLTARAYDLGVPHLSSVTQIRVLGGATMEARIMMFVVPGEHPDSTKTAEALAAITGGRVTVLETRPYVPRNQTGGPNSTSSNKTIVVARVEQTDIGTALVDVEKIRDTLAASGVGIINGTDTVTEIPINAGTAKPTTGSGSQNNSTTALPIVVTNVINEEVVVYKAENKLLFWLLIILGLLMLAAIAALIICCICPGCPFYMAPRKRRVHSSETLIVRSDGRPKRHLHRKPIATTDGAYNNGRKQAWSADPTRRNWQFNRRNIKNCGLASLPGDVAYISGRANDVLVNADSGRLRDAHIYAPTGRRRMGEQEGLYVEDVEAQKGRTYDAAELDSLQRHEMERTSDAARQGYRQRYVETEMNDENHSIREQLFYREGNAEVLRLVTRGQADEATASHHHHYHRQPTTLVIDGKDIILRRFMEDQKSRHDLSVHDMEAARSMDSHRRSQEVLQQQQEIILIPDRLEVGRRQHVDELGPAVQRLVIDHGDYETRKIDGKDSLIKETPRRSERHESVAPGMSSTTERASVITKERVQKSGVPYSFHDLELAKQNVLLTRLLLERENRQVGVGAMDSTSYLETQSLPGQVAIATQTDRTAATQTERHVRSRSDNDESDDEAKHRRKLKPRKRYGDSDWKRTRALWMKSPIEEEEGPYFDKRLSILRKKVKEVKEGKRKPLEPEVLREISDSLNGNSSSNKAEDDSRQTYERSTEQTSIRYKVLNEDETGSPSSAEISKTKRQRIYTEQTRVDASDDAKVNGTESTSSHDAKDHHEQRSPGKFEKSPRREGKSKVPRKSDSTTKPSFRILEKEITMLTKKLSKLSDKKIEGSAVSDSTSQEKSESTPSEFGKDSDPRASRKPEATSRGQKDASSTSKIMAEQGTISRKEAAIAKTRQKLKYQQSQVMSTGSSEYDDNFDKPKKQGYKPIEDFSKQKQATSQQKLKRQSHVEHHEHKKQDSEEQDDIELQKSIKETRRVESQPDKPERYERHEKSEKFEKTAKLETDEKSEKSEKREKPEKPPRASRPPKLGTMTRAETLQEASGTTGSSDGSAKKPTRSLRDSEKKNSTESSDNNSNDSDKPQGQAVSKERGGRRQTSTESTESQSHQEHQIDPQNGHEVTKGESVVSDKKGAIKHKQTKREIPMEKAGSEKKAKSTDSSTKSEHLQNSSRKKEETASSEELDKEKEKHFLKKLPSVARQYAEEITTAALTMIAIKNRGKVKDEVKPSDSTGAEISVISNKETDKHAKETHPMDTEAGVEGKLDDNTKDSMLLKGTEKQDEDTVIDNASKPEVIQSKEETTEIRGHENGHEEKPPQTTPITDVQEKLKEAVETIKEEAEEISGFTIHKIPEAHEWPDKFEDDFSDMHIEHDAEDNIAEKIAQTVDKGLSSDDKQALKETAVSAVEDTKTGVDILKDIPQDIESLGEKVSETVKKLTNGESKQSEHEEEKLEDMTTTSEQTEEPEDISNRSCEEKDFPEGKSPESTEGDGKQQPVIYSTGDNSQQDKSDTLSATVTEGDTTIKMPKSGGHESVVEMPDSGAKDTEQEFPRPLTPDTNMIQTATGKAEEVNTPPESRRSVSPGIEQETRRPSKPSDTSLQLETDDQSKPIISDKQMSPELSTGTSEKQGVIDSGKSSTEIKESLEDNAKIKEEGETVHETQEVEKEGATEKIMTTDQKEDATTTKTQPELTEEGNSEGTSQHKEENEGEGLAPESMKDETEKKDDAVEITRSEHETEQAGQGGDIKSTDLEKKQEDKEDSIQSTEHEKEKDDNSLTTTTASKKDEDQETTMERAGYEKTEELEELTTTTTEPEIKDEQKADPVEVIDHEEPVEEVTKYDEKISGVPTNKDLKESADGLSPTLQNSAHEDLIQTPEEKLPEDDIIQGEKPGEQQLPSQDLGPLETAIKEGDEIKVGKDEPTELQENVTPSILTSPAEDRESVSSKIQETKMEVALGIPAAEEVPKIGFLESDVNIKHLETPTPEIIQSPASSTESTAEEPTQDSDNKPDIEDSSLNVTDENPESSTTSDTPSVPLSETPDQITVPEEDKTLAPKEKAGKLEPTEDELSHKVAEGEFSRSKSVEESEKSEETIPLDGELETAESVLPTKEISTSISATEGSADTLAKAPVAISQDKAEISAEAKQEPIKEKPEQTPSIESTVSALKSPAEKFSVTDVDQKEESTPKTAGQQIDANDREQNEPLDSLEASDDTSSVSTLPVIPESLISGSEIPDQGTNLSLEATSTTKSDSTEAPEAKEQLALAAEATDPETTKESSEGRSFIILDSEAHSREVGQLNKEKESGDTLSDDPVKHEAQKITSPEGKEPPEEAGDKILLEKAGEQKLDLPDFTEKIEHDVDAAAEYAGLDLPVFTSAIDPLDISDDSDSSMSSDVSRKTTLTTGPYQTPRHHARSSSEKESLESETKLTPDDSSDKEIMDITDTSDEQDTAGDSNLEEGIKATEDTDKLSSKVTGDPVENEPPRIEKEEVPPASVLPKENEEPLPSTSSQMKGVEEFVDIQPILKFEKGITKDIGNGKGMKTLLDTKDPSVSKQKKSLEGQVSPGLESETPDADSLKAEDDVKDKESSLIPPPKKENGKTIDQRKTLDAKAEGIGVSKVAEGVKVKKTSVISPPKKENGKSVDQRKPAASKIEDAGPSKVETSVKTKDPGSITTAPKKERDKKMDQKKVLHTKADDASFVKLEEIVKPKDPTSVPSTSDQKKPSFLDKSHSFKTKSHKPSPDQTKRKPTDQELHKSRDRSKSREPSTEKQLERAADRNRRRHSDDEKQKHSEERRHRYSEQPKTPRKPLDDPPQKPAEDLVRKSSIPKPRREPLKKSSSSEKAASPPKPAEIDLSKAQPKYMAWYKKNQEEMERRRSELKPSEDDEQLPRWLRRSMKRSRTGKDDKKNADPKTPEATPRAKRKVKPLVNVESEQLKAIVRQGRKLRRAEGGANADPPVQIFATSPPETAAPETRHHLVQHSEYKYEKIPPPFYLHPPPAPHPSPQMSPEHFEAQAATECRHHQEDFDSGIAMPVQGTARLRHQQLLEKKSVFDIAYSEAAPSQLRPDSTTPPS